MAKTKYAKDDREESDKLALKLVKVMVDSSLAKPMKSRAWSRASKTLKLMGQK